MEPLPRQSWLAATNYLNLLTGCGAGRANILMLQATACNNWVMNSERESLSRASLNSPGEVAEWSNALDLKSSVARATVGSNPTLSVDSNYFIKTVATVVKPVADIFQADLSQSLLNRVMQSLFGARAN